MFWNKIKLPSYKPGKIQKNTLVWQIRHQAEIKETQSLLPFFSCNSRMTLGRSLLSVPQLPFLLSSYMLWDRDLLLQYAGTILRSTESRPGKSQESTVTSCAMSSRKYNQIHPAFLLISVFSLRNSSSLLHVSCGNPFHTMLPVSPTQSKFSHRNLHLDTHPK